MKIKRMYTEEEISSYVVAEDVLKQYPNIDYAELKPLESYVSGGDPIYFQLNVTLDGPEDEPVFVYGSGIVGDYKEFKEDMLGGKKSFALYFEDMENECITEIGENAFCGLPVTHIVISGHIKKIGKAAFADCKYLDSVVIPEGVEIVEEKAFANCKSLKKIVLPASLKKLANNAFEGCGDIEILSNEKNLKGIE